MLKLQLPPAQVAGIAGGAACFTLEPKESGAVGEGERWRPAPGFEDIYAVSDRGRVMRVGVGAGARLGRILQPTVTAKGYHRVELRAGGRRVALYVQRLVLLAFVGPAPNDTDLARHLDGDRTNNRLDNLAWGTPRDNYEDAIGHGTIQRDAAGRFIDWEGW